MFPHEIILCLTKRLGTDRFSTILEYDLVGIGNEHRMLKIFLFLLVIQWAIVNAEGILVKTP